MTNRRQFLIEAASATAAGISIFGMNRPLFAAGSDSRPASTATAKSIIQIWMWGGPSHLDTFDPKPEAGDDYCGPLKSPVQTSVPGIWIGEQFPHLARQAEKYSIIRSMTHGVNAHETASYLVQTGREVDGKRVYPAIGSVVSLMKGVDHGYQCTIPPYVVLTTSQGRFSKSGFLGAKYKPFITGGDPNREPFLVDGYVVEGVDQDRQMRRRKMLSSFDAFGDQSDPHLQQIDQTRESAYSQILGEDRATFDLSQESDRVREIYGRNWFGQSCLMARRLVEKGVPYITINYPGWDTHKAHFPFLQRNHPDLDRGMASLLQDLSNRGLLDSTIVWWGGEFGRTPKVAWDAPWNGGRGHFGQCFNCVVAGGGFQGGTVVGKSNRTGEEVVDRPVHPQDLLGSFCHLMGINPDASFPRSTGVDLPVMPPESTGGRLNEIMKG